MISEEYPKAVKNLIEKNESTNREKVLAISKKLVDVISKDGILYVFGSGHSAILVEEAFHRAGGLVPVYPMMYPFLSPHTSPKISGKLERLQGVAQILFAHAKPTSKDMVFIASNSGINAAAIEMAELCKKNNIPTVAFTSLEHSKRAVSRHSTGKKMYEFCDFVLDNCCVSGDAMVGFNETRVAAGSSIANNFLYHWILTSSCEIWKSEGKKLPIYLSANLPGGDTHNELLESEYRSRIPQL